MSINSRVVYKVVKWTVAVLSYAFLVYVLLTFDSYSELLSQWEDSFSAGRWGWLLLVFLLWPVNLSLEAVKWRFLTAKLQRLGFGQAFLSVLAGDVAAFFTPNRLGEVAGRCMFLNEENRLKGISLTVSNGVSQTLAICLFGVPSLVLSAVAYGKDGVTNSHVVLFVCLFLAILLVYAFLPRIFAFLSGLSRVPSSVVRFLEPLCAHTSADLAKVLFVSSCRYVVFSLQYYFMLRFFMIDLPLAYGAIFIATNYLIITFVPSMSFSELAVRAGVASVVFAPLTDNMIGVMATGASTWLVNYLLPMLLGSVVWLKYNPEKKKNLESYG